MAPRPQGPLCGNGTYGEAFRRIGMFLAGATIVLVIFKALPVPQGGIPLGGGIVLPRGEQASKNAPSDSASASAADIQWRDHDGADVYCHLLTGVWQLADEDGTGKAGGRGLFDSGEPFEPPVDAAGHARPADVQVDEAVSNGDDRAAQAAGQGAARRLDAAGDWGVASSTARDLPRAMSMPSWQLRADWVRRQYSWLQGHRVALEKAVREGRGTAQAAQGSAASSSSSYSSLSIPDGLLDAYGSGGSPRAEAVNASVTSPVWAWPLTELWPMPSLVAVGLDEASSGAPWTAGPSGLDADVRALLLASSVDTLWHIQQRPGPIHGRVRLEGHNGSSTAAAGSSSDGIGGAWHERDSLRFNASAPSQPGYLSPWFVFRLSAASRADGHLSNAERSSIKAAMGRACTRMAAAYSGRLTDAVTLAYGAGRDAGVCRQHDPYARARDLGGRDGGQGAESVESAEALPAGRKLPGAATSPSSSAPPPRPGAGGANGQAGARLPVVLHILEVDIIRSDKAAVRAGFDHSVPHINMSEGYALRISVSDWSSTSSGAAPSAQATSSAKARGPTPKAADGIAQEAQAVLTSDTVWGALRGLETFVQVTSSSWGVLQPSLPTQIKPGSGKATRFDSPVRTILACSATEGSGASNCRDKLPRYAGAATAIAVAESEAVIAGGPSCAVETLDRLQGGGDTMDSGRSNNAVASFDYAAAIPVRLPLLIIDRPWKTWRGVSLDTARHFLPVRGIQNMLDGMEAAKFSVLHWHISDAQSFPLGLKKHPELSRQGAWAADKVYTTEEVKAIVAYASARGIRIVPEYDMPAHAAAIGHSHPDALVHCSNVGGSVHDLDKYALDPTSETAYRLIADLFNETADMFPDEYLHVGADEVAPECWASEHRLSEWAMTNVPQLLEAQGWTPPAEGTAVGSGRAKLPSSSQLYVALLAYFLHRVDAIVRANNRKMVAWEDSYEKIKQAGGRRLQSTGQGSELGRSAAARASRSREAGARPVQMPNGRLTGSGLPADLPGTVTRLRALLSSGDRGQAGEQQAMQQGGASRQLQDALAPSDPHSVPMSFPPGSVIQGWKCWVSHADAVLAEAATDGMGYDGSYERMEWLDEASDSSLRGLEDEDGDGDTAGAPSRAAAEASSSFESGPREAASSSSTRDHRDPSTVPAMGRGVIQSACWYMDYSSAWGDYYRHWALPEKSGPMGRYQDHVLQQLREQGVDAQQAVAAVDGVMPQGATAVSSAISTSQLTTYPPSLFSKHPYWGGEGAIWTERIDASNIFCRVWPRLAVPSEVLWSESLGYDRYARQYGSEPPYKDGWNKGPNGQGDTAQHLFAAPRYLNFIRTLLYRGLPASPTAVFDIHGAPAASDSGNSGNSRDQLALFDGSATDSGSGSGSGKGQPLGLPLDSLIGVLSPLKPVFEEGAQQFPFNGLCPGIEQAIQRPKDRLESFLAPLAGGDGAKGLPSPALEPPVASTGADKHATATATTVPSPGRSHVRGLQAPAEASGGHAHALTPKLQFLSWNIHDGAISHGRYGKFMSYLQRLDVDVVGLIEASDWEKASVRLLREDRQLQATGGATEIGQTVASSEAIDAHGHTASDEETMSTAHRARLLALEAGLDADPPVFSGHPDEAAEVASSGTESHGTASDSADGHHSGRVLATQHDLEPSLEDQTAGFRRRAANAGYTYARLLRQAGGYHLALLSARPMTVVLEDKVHFERGLIVADIAGVRFMLVHLHAQSALKRAEEARHVRALVAIYTAAGVPVVVLGDFNSVSPDDAACHAAQDLIGALSRPDVPAYLRDKYLCHGAAADDAGCAQQKAIVADPAHGTDWHVDYRPLYALLHATDESKGLSGRPLVDLTIRLPRSRWAATRNFTASGSTDSSSVECLISYPTAALSPDADDAGNDNGHIPLRIDFALSNALAVAQYPDLGCTVGLPQGWDAGDDSKIKTEELDTGLLGVSDHLPLHCCSHSLS